MVPSTLVDTQTQPPGIELVSPALQADSLPTELSGKPNPKTVYSSTEHG